MSNKLAYELSDSQIVESCFDQIKELVIKNLFKGKFEVVDFVNLYSNAYIANIICIGVNLSFVSNYDKEFKQFSQSTWIDKSNYRNLGLDKEQLLALHSVFYAKFKESETERKITERAKKMQELAVLKSELNLELA